MSLRVGAASTGGAKSWSLRFRIGRIQRRLTLGGYPELSLADARERATDALKRVANGKDPALKKQERRDAETVAEFSETYIEKYAKLKKKSWKVDQTRLKISVLPHWKHRLMRDITRRDVRELVDGVAARGAAVVGNRVRALLHKFFNYARELDVLDVNPVTGTPRPGIETQRDRVLTSDELRQFWTACDALPLEMGAAYKLRLLTAQRGGEVFQMRWQDVDLDGGWWTIPTMHSKNKLSHRVPLSAPALELLKSIRALQDERLSHQKVPKPSPFVFRYARGARQHAEAVETFRIDDFRGHDLRRTAASQGHFVIMQAEWLSDGGRVELARVSRVLVRAEDVEMVELMEVQEHCATGDTEWEIAGSQHHHRRRPDRVS